jgi:hypothetical protein
MAINHPYEFWAKDKEGREYHEFFNYTSTKNKKIIEHIEKKYKFIVSECEVFDYRRNNDL